MTKKLVLASAGAGKTEEIVSDAVKRHSAGETVLLLTYTENNQLELRQRIAKKLGAVPNGIRVKGWFTFLREDLVVPYQRVFSARRIENIQFNQTHPHRVPGKHTQLPGRAEYDQTKQLNPLHFLTRSGDRAHTMFISKLACRLSEVPSICSKQKLGRKTIKHGFAFQRLNEIYDTIIVDEVQDLTGWDYVVLQKLTACDGLNLVCVGDFRQTVYSTHIDNKKPVTIEDKIEQFDQLGFERQDKFVSHRCVQPICDFADDIHKTLNLPATKSLVESDGQQHIGMFVVGHCQLDDYCTTFSPTILRNSRSEAQEICRDREVYNFGEAKGLQFRRTLIIPTARQRAYLEGDDDAFSSLSTNKEINRFYVAVTRAEYSTALLHDGQTIRPNVHRWTPKA